MMLYKDLNIYNYFNHSLHATMIVHYLILAQYSTANIILETITKAIKS